MDFFEWATAVDMELVPLFGAGAGGRLGDLGGGKGDGAGAGGGGGGGSRTGGEADVPG